MVKCDSRLGKYNRKFLVLFEHHLQYNFRYESEYVANFHLTTHFVRVVVGFVEYQ